jgi:hypothetical protein
VLTEILELRPVYAYLIFGGLHLAIAAGLMFVGVHYLQQKDDLEDEIKKDVKAASSGDARAAVGGKAADRSDTETVKSGEGI